MRSPTRDLLLAICTSVVLSGCGGYIRPPPMSSPEIADEVDEAGNQMIDELIALRSRILEIEFRLTRAASPLCGKWNRPHVGVLVTKRSSFKERNIREVASDMLLASDDVTIIYVVPGAPFDRAGLRAGDELISIAGKRTKSAAGLMQRLLELEGASTVNVRYRRDGVLEKDAAVLLDPACPVRFGYATSALIVPWQVKRVYIAIPLGLLKYATDDSTLAIAMAHQLAHSLFDKPDDEPFDRETRADSMGLRIAAAAGFDVGVATAYWEAVAAEYPSLIQRGRHERAKNHGPEEVHEQLPHGDIARRLETIRDEIERQSSDPDGSARGGD
jgi:hypothetical protein